MVWYLCPIPFLKDCKGKRQLIYDYKGIRDWSVLSDVVTHNIYYLKENYRNTNQITEFCNHKFNCNIISIGYSAISNGYGIIEWCNIILYSKSKLYNNKSNYGIKNCIITLNNVCEFYSYGLISDSYIFLYDSTEFLNHNNNALYGILTNTYIFVFDNCKISNTKNDSSGYFVNSLLRSSNSLFLSSIFCLTILSLCSLLYLSNCCN